MTGSTRWRCVDCGRHVEGRPKTCPKCGSDEFEQLHLF